jgi:hypothetical protein
MIMYGEARDDVSLINPSFHTFAIFYLLDAPIVIV